MNDAAPAHAGTPSSAAAPRLALAVGVLLVAFGAAWWRFGPFFPQVLFGDDLGNLFAFRDEKFASSLGQALVGSFYEKFRPVWATACWITFSTLGDRLGSYMVLNLLVHSTSAALVFACARRLSRGSLVVAFACTLAFATCRFGLYQVTQVTGLVESLALLGFLSTVYAVVRASEPGAMKRWPWIALAAAFLAVHTHERYLVVLPWLAAIGFGWARSERWSRRRLAGWVAACMGIIAFNVAVKRAMHLPVLVGTGGTHLSLDIPQAWLQTVEALLSLFGVNHGPNYLVGGSVLAIGSTMAWVLSEIIVIAWGVAVVSGVRRAVRRERDGSLLASPWVTVALIAVLVLLLAPAVATIRLEQRWLLAPYSVLLLLLAWSVGARGGPRLLASVPVVAFVIATIAQDSHLSGYFGNVFFVAAGRAAAIVKREVIDRPLPPGEVALLSTPELCGWALENGLFFRQYGRRGATVRCVPNPPGAKPLEEYSAVLSYEGRASEHVRDVTAVVQSAERTH